MNLNISTIQQTNVANFFSKMTHKTIFTLVFVKKNSEVLLGLKTRGFGVGLWNGFGGKVEGEESIIEGAKRELKEESNIEAPNLSHVGIVTYEDDKSPHKSVVHIFTTNNFKGHIKASEEMNPIRWYNYEDIPYHKMWPDAKYWYPLMLKDKCFSAFIKYGSNEIIHTDIKQHAGIHQFLEDQV